MRFQERKENAHNISKVKMKTVSYTKKEGENEAYYDVKNDGD